ncbi:MAG: DUF2207 family protein [Candidatus Zhuqueibacterota bacterium]
MNKIFRFSISLFIILFVTVLSQIDPAFADKYFTIESIKIAAQVDSAGSLWIEEHRTYDFHGKFSWADYELPLDNLGPVTNFSLREDDRQFRNESTHQPGTFEFSQNSDEFKVKWYYNARNEQRTFTLRYRISDAVTRYDDIAELHFKFVGTYSKRTIGLVDVRVQLPHVADTSTVRAWAHGPLNGQLAFEREQIHLWAQPLPRKNHLVARIIFPNEWVPLAKKMIDKNARQEIMAKEAELVAASDNARMEKQRKSDFKREHQQDAMVFAILLSGFGLFVLVFLYQQYGKPFPTDTRFNYTSEIPAGVSPALANYIHSTGQMDAGALVATLFDLARRGYIRIEEKKIQKKSIFGVKEKTTYAVLINKDFYRANTKGLLPHEIDLIDFLFNKLAAGDDQILFDTISRSGQKFVKWFIEWKKVVKRDWGRDSFYDPQSVKGTVYSALFSLFIFAVGFAGVVIYGEPAIIAIISGLVLFGLSFTILRFQKDVKEMKQRLDGLSVYLKKFHFRREQDGLKSRLESYFIYGLALGAGNKFIGEMLVALPDWQSTAVFPWYLGATTHYSPVHFANSVSSMVTSISGVMGSAAGVGGAATAGGAGAAGGASGGAG